MNELFWPFLLSIIAGFSTMIGCIFIFIPVKRIKEFIVLSLSISFTVMILISIFDLIPSALSYMPKDIFKIIFKVTIFFIPGVITVLIFNKLLEKGQGSSLYKIGLLSFLALVLHNLPEGILTFLSTYEDFSLGLSVCIAIAMHNIPEGISIAVPIYYSTNSRFKAIKSTFYSALAEPLGALLAFMVFKRFISDELVSLFLVFVAGIMITLSINKMFPEALSYKKKKPMIIGMLIGLLFVGISLLI